MPWPPPPLPLQPPQSSRVDRCDHAQCQAHCEEYGERCPVPPQPECAALRPERYMYMINLTHVYADRQRKESKVKSEGRQ